MSKSVIDKIEYLILLVSEFAARSMCPKARPITISGNMVRWRFAKGITTSCTPFQHDFSMQEAFDAVYNSLLFEKLNNPKTGLYFQSPGYVYSYLKDELFKVE